MAGANMTKNFNAKGLTPTTSEFYNLFNAYMGGNIIGGKIEELNPRLDTLNTNKIN